MCFAILALSTMVAFAAGVGFERMRTRRDRRVERITRAIVETMPAHAWQHAPDGTFTYLNPSLSDYFGLPDEAFQRGKRRAAAVDEHIRRLQDSVLHPDDAEAVVAKWHDCRARRARFTSDHRLRRADGAYRWYRVDLYPDLDPAGRIRAWHGTEIDIDDLKRTERELRNRERALQRIVDTVPVMIWCGDAEGRPQYFNRRMRQFADIKPEDFDEPGPARLSALLKALHHPDDAAGSERVLRHSFATGQPFFHRYRSRRADGVYRWIEGRAECLRDEDNAILQWFGVAIDIEEQVNAEAALLQREQELKRLIDTVPAQIWSVAPEGFTSYLNKSLQTYTGQPAPEPGAARLPFRDLLARILHPEDVQRVTQALMASLQTGASFAQRYRIRRADGEYRWNEGRAQALRDGEGGVLQWYGVCFDTNDLMEAEAALREAQTTLSRAAHSASLAELSASIAHEVNQPLAAIVANSDACERWLIAEPPNLERARLSLQRVIRDANGAAEVVARVRALFRQSRTARRAERINAMVTEVCRMMTAEAGGKSIDIATELTPADPEVWLDRVQFQQVLVNLTRNAIEAMGEDGGRIVVRTAMDGDEVRIAVEDEGSGVAEPARVFDPFVSTKDGGMGMGLSICRTIVESHEGRIWVEANRARGATIALALPRREPAPAAGDAS
ncbi:PAS domain-containing sensor histidine kinase [Acuticoccus sediminis]|uniref:PAS domain-containing sensor histidine kinase n=1 Tax=Acuticoccus sediminis TaxID=2184697 RepID=UPI001CFF1694|nr:PAS domain-containing sensor histidine kinase [Acuticoccus sediminis]